MPSAAEHSPVVRALLEAAVHATGAACGWLVALGAGEELVVVDAVGDRAGSLPGATAPVDAGTAGFVIASGQPVALGASGGGEQLSGGIAALLDPPPVSIASVPCASADDVLGALELADKAGGTAFTFDDVELASLLAGIAGAALSSAAGDTLVRHAPDPHQLGTELLRLAGADPVRYVMIAGAVDALLAGA